MSNVPSLSGSGWIRDIVNRSTQLMDYFLVADYSQTQLYKGHVSSLPYLVQQYGDSRERLAENIRTTLSRYFRRYFEAVNVNTSTTLVEGGDGRYNVSIECTIEDQGQSFSFGRAIEVGQSKILNVTSDDQSG